MSEDNTEQRESEFSKKPDSLMSEAAEQMARHFANQQEAIVKALDACPEVDQPDLTLKKDDNFSPKTKFTLRGADVHRLGATSITLEEERTPESSNSDNNGEVVYYIGELPHYLYAQAQGVRTRFSLELKGVHTDEATREQAAALMQKDPKTKGRQRSLYFFDQNGHYGKMAEIPKLVDGVIQEGGSSRLGKFWTWDLESAEMTPGDFELVGSALDRLQQASQTLQK